MNPYAKPRLAGRGFAQSTGRLLAFLHYYIGKAGANARLSFFAASDSAALPGGCRYD